MNKITAEFLSVEQAEAAASRVRSTVGGVGAITVTSRTVQKDKDTPFMLPYAPKHGRDPWIMLPDRYGYATTNGYLERTGDVTCSVTVEADGATESVAAVLHNCGALSVDRSRM